MVVVLAYSISNVVVASKLATVQSKTQPDESQPDPGAVKRQNKTPGCLNM